MEKTGVRGATLGFVVSDKGTCAASRDIQRNLGDVTAFIAAGGHVKVSFGGFDELYLEEACADAAALEGAIGDFLDETGLTDLDFDIEKAGTLTAELNARRNTALVALQAKRKLRVSFTLSSYPRSKIGEPGGIRPEGFETLESAVAAGVVITRVNLLTMDFGAAYSSGRLMGPLAISALTDAADQLKVLYPSLDEAGAFRMLGATPMIGQNDKPTEIFTVDDVATLVDFAKSKGLGLLSFWAVQRDSPTCTLSGLYSCSQAQTEPFEFSKAFVSRL
jgi:chitinase